MPELPVEELRRRAESLLRREWGSDYLSKDAVLIYGNTRISVFGGGFEVWHCGLVILIRRETRYGNRTSCCLNGPGINTCLRELRQLTVLDDLANV